MTLTIKIRDNGPYILEGDEEVRLVDAAGNEVPMKKRVLCRCGGSIMKPFCDGTHSKIGFQGASAAVEDSGK